MVGHFDFSRIVLIASTSSLVELPVDEACKFLRESFGAIVWVVSFVFGVPVLVLRELPRVPPLVAIYSGRG